MNGFWTSAEAIARTYHWTEPEILALEPARFMMWAGMARQRLKEG